MEPLKLAIQTGKRTKMCSNPESNAPTNNSYLLQFTFIDMQAKLDNLAHR